MKKWGLNRDLNPGPPAPEAGIIPLDHWAPALMEVYTIYTYIKSAIIVNVDRGENMSTTFLANHTFFLYFLLPEFPFSTDGTINFCLANTLIHSTPLGVVACSCNPATWKRVLWDGLRKGFLSAIGSCRSGVRTKTCINMASFRELKGIRLSKEGRTGPGRKPSSQESPCGSVVGSH